MQENAITLSTIGRWFVILIVAVCMWEVARNLWANWGTSNFWTSSFAAALVGMLIWWAIGAIAYLSSPQKAIGAASATAAPVTQSTPATGGSAQNQSNVTASGGSTVIQAGGNVTIINQGKSETEVKKEINKTQSELFSQLVAKYPEGYVLIGVADGKIVYEPKFQKIRIEGDLDDWKFRIDDAANTVSLQIPHLILRNSEGGKMELRNVGVNSQFQDGQSASLLIRAGDVIPFFEVIDRDKPIFVLGLKRAGHQ